MQESAMLLSRGTARKAAGSKENRPRGGNDFGKKRQGVHSGGGGEKGHLSGGRLTSLAMVRTFCLFGFKKPMNEYS